MPTGDQKVTGSNFKVATSIPIFLTPNKSKYLIVGGNLETFNFSDKHPEFDVECVYSVSLSILEKESGAAPLSGYLKFK